MPEINPNDRYLALKVMMMPRDTNPHGTIFGGVILSYIDQAGAVGATYEMRRAGWQVLPLVTVAMKSVEFHQPIIVGDAVSLWSTLVHIGTTSITMHVDVEADRGGQIDHLTAAEVTYVAVNLAGGERNPIPIKGHLGVE